MKVLILLCSLVCFNGFCGEIYKTDIELSPTVLASESPYELTVVYSIGPVDLSVGDIVDFRLQAEFTNDCGDNIGLGRYIIRTDSESNATGYKVNKSVMQNITPDMHHGVVVHSGLDEIKSDIYGAYYNVVFFAASSVNRCAGDYLDVEGYGTSSYGEFLIEVR